MTPQVNSTMTVEDALMEIRMLQLKHGQEIQQLQESFKIIQDKVTSINNTCNTKIQEVCKTIENNMKNSNEKLEIITEKQSIVLTTVREGFQDIKQDLAKIMTVLKSNTSPSIIKESSPIHNNLPENNRPQIIVMPTTTPAPIFRGKPTEGPRRFLIHVEVYTQEVYKWGEDMLLRGMSQFLRDYALEWYCQLRRYQNFPKTWSDFKEIFLEQFNPPIRIAQRQVKWDECIQNKYETFNEFLVRLRGLWMEQFPHESESDLAKHLLQKMRSDLLYMVKIQSNDSFENIIFRARKAEEILYYQMQ